MHISSTLAILALCSVPALSFAQSETAKLLASDGAADDRFGYAVATDGEIGVMGADADDAPGLDSGSAYVFNTTTHQQLAKLIASDGEAGDLFGRSVAVSGSVTVVGAPLDDDNGIDSGSAYLFDTGTGMQIAKLLPDDGAAGDWFGFPVAISGSTVLVGALADDISFTNDGSAYLFDAATGTQLAKLLPNDPGLGHEFGRSVGISGTTAIVGAWFDDANGTLSGSAYLFDVLSGTQLAKLLPTDGAAGDQFGISAQIHDSLALVGAVGKDDSGQDSGAAYLFNAVTGIQILKILPPDGTPGAMFGRSVALQGSVGVIGAYLDDAMGVDSGSAYIVDLSTGGTVQKLFPSDGAANDQFGFSVDIRGTMAIVGASLNDDNGTDSGSAYIFDIPDPSGTSFCSGDGTGAPCPCGNNGLPDEGCMNSTGVSGASLRGHGTPSITSDTFWLEVSGVPGAKPGLLLRGSNQHQGGIGAPIGDGLLCTSSQTARSQVQVTAGGATDFTDFQGSPFGAWSYGPGAPAYYQFWYRDPQNTCTGLGFNFSNAWAVLWLP